MRRADIPLPPGEVEPCEGKVRVRASQAQINHARRLRERQTEAEARLWRHLRNGGLGVKFRRQVPVGRYIADFLCPEMKLIVEVDGTQHAEEMLEHDRSRDSQLHERGYTVHRVWNRDALANTQDVLNGIALTIDALTRSGVAAASTSPGGRGEVRSK